MGTVAKQAAHVAASINGALDLFDEAEQAAAARGIRPCPVTGPEPDVLLARCAAALDLLAPDGLATQAGHVRDPEHVIADALTAFGPFVLELQRLRHAIERVAMHDWTIVAVGSEWEVCRVSDGEIIPDSCGVTPWGAASRASAVESADDWGPLW